MNMQRVAAPQLQPYEAKLGLSWPVSYWLVPGEQTCRIVCDSGSCAHEVWAHEGAITNFDLSPVFRGPGREVRKFVDQVARFYGSLPRLSCNRVQDIKTYAASVIKAAKILGLGIRPRLVEDEKQAEWEV